MTELDYRKALMFRGHQLRFRYEIYSRTVCRYIKFFLKDKTLSSNYIHDLIIEELFTSNGKEFPGTFLI